MKNEVPHSEYQDDAETNKLYAMIHLIREAGFSDGFFSPEQQAVFLDELENIEHSTFRNISKEHINELIHHLDSDIQKLGADKITAKAVKALSDLKLKEQVFTAAFKIISAGEGDRAELNYIKKLQKSFHLTDSDASKLIGKVAAT